METNDADRDVRAPTILWKHMNIQEKQQRFERLERQVRRFSKIIQRLEKRSNRLSWARLIVFVIGVICTYMAFQFAALVWGWSFLCVFTLAFSTLVCFHISVERGIKRHKIWRNIKQTHIARMQLDWENIPHRPIHAEMKRSHHEIDLNLTGERSLLHCLDTTVSYTSRYRLLHWLLDTKPEMPEVYRRQKTVMELKPMENFRNRLILITEFMRKKKGEEWEGEKLLDWLNRHSLQMPLKRTVSILSLLAATNIVLFFLTFNYQFPPLWTISFLIYILYYLSKIKIASRLFHEATHIQETLETFRALLLFLENYPYEKETNLSRLCEPIWNHEHSPSVFLKKIEWIEAAAGCSQRNPVGGIVLNIICPWDLIFTLRLEEYKKKIRQPLKHWLETVFELDALCSLANFADLNPEMIFPTIQKLPDNNTAVIFAAKELGHPLIPDYQRVCNDFSFHESGEIAIITGSNMSGKSTFLRTIGINLCLAYAGGPVVAKAFETIPFRLFSCINVSDSLSDGLSHFYAEVRRLRKLLDEIEKKHPYPVFFLIDEIFRGTNNKERQIGSTAYVKFLSTKDCVGIISTHDLELVHLEEECERIRNHHFREQIEEGRMSFDYRLHDGPCPTTNALTIMRIEGLPVE